MTDSMNFIIFLVIAVVALALHLRRLRKTGSTIFTPWWEWKYFEFMGWDKETVKEYRDKLARSA